MSVKVFFNVLLIGLLCLQCSAQDQPTKNATKVVVEPTLIQPPLVVAAERTKLYLPSLSEKRVGIVANHSSMLNQTHLVDSLVALGINVEKVFSPEHGFRGKADAGEKVSSDIDKKTGLTIVSLYGKNKKPTPEQLNDIDVMVFDIQDVGARFYTYISTLHYVMEACAEKNIPLLVLDRPNPNGHYVDGPVLEDEFKSFVGMHKVPIVHGMTVGEYSEMINSEGWLANGIKCNLTVIKVLNYTHSTYYKLPIKPSPNLPNMSSIYLYPSLCLFEGTPISVGRGTASPFQVLGHPTIKSDRFSFTPTSMEGAKSPKLVNKKCMGYNLSEFGNDYMKKNSHINLFWLIDIYKNYPNKEDFFNGSFNRLAGTDKLQTQLKSGISEKEIYNSWKPGIKKFKETRKKYLLYPDFE